jgi:hypothetical protein
MLVGGCFRGFEFDDQAALDEQVGKIFAYRRAIFIKHGKWPLLFYFEPDLTESVSQGVLVHFLEMAIAEIFVNSERSFSHDITKLADVCLILHVMRLQGCSVIFLRPLVPFRGHLVFRELLCFSWLSYSSMLAWGFFCCPAVGVRVKLLQAVALPRA